VNYHLKELDRAGLVRRVGERRNRNFVESLYRSVARTFVVSPRVAWGNPRRVRAMREQLSLETLVHLGERLERDAVALLDRAAFEGEEVASSSVEVEIRLAGEEDRARFLKEYLAAVRPVIERHQRAEGDRYRVVLAAYPDPNRRRRQEVNNPARPGHRPPPPPLGPARSASDLPEPDLNQSRV
jgi:hypothetical protein